MEISKNIFREYDIRGVYPDSLDESTALAIGRALGTDFKQKDVKEVVVGIDNRESSPKLSESLIQGLLSTGINVTFIGIVTTPMVYFFSCDERFDAAIMVTASHNPKDQNGFKVSLKNGMAYSGAEITNIYDLAQSGVFLEGEGAHKNEDLSQDYVDFIVNNISERPTKNLKIVLSCGNGSASEIAPKIFSLLGAEVVPHLCKFDSDFPNGVPDPEKEIFLEKSKEQVLLNHADAGFVYDADADRLGVVDEKGAHHAMDRVLMLLAKYVLKNKPGGKVVYDVKCSKNVAKFVSKYGGIPEMMRTGHSFFVKKTTTGEAVLGGEYSGHIFLADKYFGFDDAVYASCRIMEIMEVEQKPLSELMSEFPVTASSTELRLNCSDDKKFDLAQSIKEKITSAKEFKNSITIDGIRADYLDKGWVLIRPSNTSAYLSARFEAENHGDLMETALAVKKILTEYKDLDISSLVNFIG